MSPDRGGLRIPFVIGVVAALTAGFVLVWVAEVPGVPGTYTAAPNCPSPDAVYFWLDSPNGSSDSLPSVQSRGTDYWYNYSFIHCGDLSAPASWLSLELANLSGQPSGTPVSFSLSFANHTTFAIENGNRVGWISGGNTSIPQTGYLSVQVDASLPGTELLAWLGGGGSPEVFPLALDTSGS